MDDATWAVNLWNATVPPGTDVLLTEDDGRMVQTTTRSKAWIASDQPVCLVEGRSGAFLLWRLEVRT